jgi:KDO2-lipid IV(A) lauroyltransferase
VAYRIDVRHRRVALSNLTMCFGNEISPDAIRELAQENFRRVGENYATAIKTAAMTWAQLSPHIEVSGTENLLPRNGEPDTQGRIIAIGHFGNFEVCARLGQFVPMFTFATTYRGLRQESLNRLMQSMRERSGCLFFERRTQGPALRLAMRQKRIMLGLLADQSERRGGIRLPFLGHECSTSSAPAVFARRYDCPLHTAICYRIGLARWRIEISSPIPTREDGRDRTSDDIMRDVNRAFETAVRRDPANWFWVHNRWKIRKRPQ